MRFSRNSRQTAICSREGARRRAHAVACRAGEGGSVCQRRSSRSSVLSRQASLRMTATMATLWGFGGRSAPGS